MNTDPDRGLGCRWVMDISMASGCNIDHRNLPDLQWQRRPEDGILIEKLLHEIDPKASLSGNFLVND